MIFSDWSATPTVAYTENTIVKHSSAIWVALTTPGAADEPGVAAVWEKITDQTGSGGGAGLSDDTPERTGEGDEDEGTGTDASRSDHTHQVTDEAAHILDSVAGIDGKVADLSIENASRTWTTLVSVSDGGFVSHAGANQLTTTQAAALTYSVTRTGDAVDGSRAYVVIRIPDTEDVRDFRIRQSFSGANYYITNWHTIGSTGGFTYGYSRHTLFAGYLIHIQEATNVTTTHFRGVSDAENVAVDVTDFTGNLSSSDDDLQTALETLDDLTGSGAGTAVDGVDVTYNTVSRVVEVEVQQDNGTDFSGTATLPQASTGVNGLARFATDTEAENAALSNRALAPGNIDAIDVEDMASGTAVSGDVPTADGSGGIDWEAQTGSGGTGTTVTANPNTSSENIYRIGIGSTNYAIPWNDHRRAGEIDLRRQPHRYVHQQLDA